MIDTFKAYLDKTNLSENSKSAYLFALRQFIEQYGSVTKKNLTAYKVWLCLLYTSPSPRDCS